MTDQPMRQEPLSGALDSSYADHLRQRLIDEYAPVPLNSLGLPAIEEAGKHAEFVRLLAAYLNEVVGRILAATLPPSAPNERQPLP